MSVCSCDYSLQNTGLPNCNYVIKYAKDAILVPMRDAAGAANKIANNAVINDAYIIAKLNDTDPSQRWYLLKDIKNANMGTPAEPVYQTFDDGSKVKIQNGVTSASFIFAASSPTFLGKLESFECENMGILFVDKGGKIVGISDGTGDMYPIEIAKNSLTSVPTYGTPTGTYFITTSFDWDLAVEHSTVATYGNTVNWNSSTITSLLDVEGSIYAAVTTTGMTLDLFTQYGDLDAPIEVEGLLLADFTLYNVTDSASITITSVTESTTVPGRYVFVFPTQTSADVLRLSGQKNGYDLTPLEDLGLVCA